MATAEIGALRITLAMDSGEFRKGAKDAEGLLSSLEKRWGLARGNLTGLGKDLAAAFTIKEIGAFILQTIEAADQLGKLAQVTGINVTELSSYKVAADLADVSMEEMVTTLARFNRNIVDSTKGINDTGIALSAMKISLFDSTGKLRETSAILGDVADRFASYADGARKSAIAQELFGRSGAQLIPLLNQGRDGLEAAKKKAEELGVVIGPDWAKKAEAFNDSWKEFKLALTGFANDIGTVIAPALTSLIEHTTSLAKSMREGAQNTRDWLGVFAEAQKQKAIQELTLQLRDLIEQRDALSRKPADQATPADIANFRLLSAEIKGVLAELNALQAAKNNIGPFTTTMGEAPDTNEEKLRQEQLIRDAQKQAADMLTMLTERTDLYNAALQNLSTPLDVYRSKILEIARAQQTSAVSATALAGMQVQAIAKMNAEIGAVAANLTGALAQLFANNKKFAIANAIVSTYQAVASALANPPGPPFSYVNAAAALIRGMAQVRQIQATSPGSSPGAGASEPAPTPAPGGGGGGGAPAPGGGAQTIFLEGITPNTTFTSDQIRTLMKSLNEHLKNGGKVVVA